MLLDIQTAKVPYIQLLASLPIEVLIGIAHRVQTMGQFVNGVAVDVPALGVGEVVTVGEVKALYKELEALRASVDGVQGNVRVICEAVGVEYVDKPIK